MKVEVAVLGSPSLTVLMVSVDVSEATLNSNWNSSRCFSYLALPIEGWRGGRGEGGGGGGVWCLFILHKLYLLFVSFTRIKHCEPAVAASRCSYHPPPTL